MLWKVGCGITLAGIALSISSCALFGTAFHKATQRHQVLERNVAIGETVMVTRVPVEAKSAAQIELRATLAMPDSVWSAEGVGAARIRDASAAVQYRVLDLYGEPIEHGAGSLRGTVIVPDPDHPAYDGFEGEIDLNFQSPVFELGDASEIHLELDVDPRSAEGWPLERATVRVYDRVPQSSKRFALGGLASFFLGPLVAGLGVLLFVIGLITRKSGANARG